MKKVEIETVCGEKSVIYVSQDVETITIDGEPFEAKTETESDKRLSPQDDDGIELVELLQRISDINKEYPWWTVSYKVILDPTDDENYLMKIDFRGTSLPEEIFKL